MKAFYFPCFLFLLFACKKEIPATELQSSDVSNNTETSSPVKTPRLVLSSTTKTQFIANADGNGTATVTYSFRATQPGISIVSFKFLAYETDTSDALSITSLLGTTVFKPTSLYMPAKAIAFKPYNANDPDNLFLPLPDDGSPVLVTFTIRYNVCSSTSKVKSGDTVSVKLTGIEGVTKSNMDPGFFEDLETALSPQIMITGSKPSLGLNIYDPDSLRIGLTRIMELEYSSVGGSLGINNLPLVVNVTNTKIKNDLVVKDENNNTINTTTIRSGKNYTIQFPAGYMLNGVNVHNFFVYAHVTQINGEASIDTYLQPPARFSWTDIAGGRVMPYTSENAIYYYNYPKNLITTTHN